MAPVNGPAPSDSLALKNISIGPFTLAAGDLNAHSSLWDEQQPDDQRGEAVEDRLISRHASILNNGEPTHVTRATGGLSTPDVTMVNSTWATKAGWPVGEHLGSDHLPITVAISCQVPNPSITHRRARWNTKDVNWQGFAGAVVVVVVVEAVA